MTTIIIENSSLKLPGKFRTEKDLLEYLVTCFDDQTFLLKTSVDELNMEEKKAWYQHKQEGYDDFVDFKG